MYVYYLLLCKFMPFFPFIFPRNVSKKRRESTKTGEDHGFSLAETTRKNSAFLRYIYIYIYIYCVYLLQRSPYLFLAACVNVVIIFIVIIIECTEKRYKYQLVNESSETFRRVDRLAADFNRLGDFYDRDNAHGDRVFSDRDKREHGRYVYYIYEKSVCFFLVLPYLC